MTIKRFAGDRYTGLSSDTKPTDILEGAVFLEIDTGNSYFYDGSSWVLESLPAEWPNITGDQSTVDLSGFNNDLTITESQISDLGSYVLKAGDTMTGGLSISMTNPFIALADVSGGSIVFAIAVSQGDAVYHASNSYDHVFSIGVTEVGRFNSTGIVGNGSQITNVDADTVDGKHVDAASVDGLLTRLDSDTRYLDPPGVFRWIYSNSTSMAAPGSVSFRMNSSSINLVSQMVFDGIQSGPGGSGFTVGTESIFQQMLEDTNGHAWIMLRRIDSTDWAYFEVTSFLEFVEYFKIDVSLKDSNFTMPASGDVVMFSILPNMGEYKRIHVGTTAPGDHSLLWVDTN